MKKKKKTCLRKKMKKKKKKEKPKQWNERCHLACSLENLIDCQLFGLSNPLKKSQLNLTIMFISRLILISNGKCVHGELEIHRI